jgi:hypothetical protein
MTPYFFFFLPKTAKIISTTKATAAGITADHISTPTTGLTSKAYHSFFTKGAVD